jgi:hypothetical protein
MVKSNGIIKQIIVMDLYHLKHIYIGYFVVIFSDGFIIILKKNKTIKLKQKQ